MHKRLIGLTGKAGVGKDTAATYLEIAHNLKQYAFAGPIKEALEAMGFERLLYDLDGVKDRLIPELGFSYRRMAQTLGTEWGRSLHPDFWLILGIRAYAELDPRFTGLVISDVRFKNEAQWIRDAGGTVIHIVGPARREIAVDGVQHASENGVERLLGDVILYNTAEPNFMFEQLDRLMEMIDVA